MLSGHCCEGSALCRHPGCILSIMRSASALKVIRPDVARSGLIMSESLSETMRKLVLTWGGPRAARGLSTPIPVPLGRTARRAPWPRTMTASPLRRRTGRRLTYLHPLSLPPCLSFILVSLVPNLFQTLSRSFSTLSLSTPLPPSLFILPDSSLLFSQRHPQKHVVLFRLLAASLVQATGSCSDLVPLRQLFTAWIIVTSHSPGKQKFFFSFWQSFSLQYQMEKKLPLGFCRCHWHTQLTNWNECYLWMIHFPTGFWHVVWKEYPHRVLCDKVKWQKSWISYDFTFTLTCVCCVFFFFYKKSLWMVFISDVLHYSQ